MKIAIDAADLCAKRIDGTRIYIKNVLDQLGAVSPNDDFFIYLKDKINPALEFRRYPNYTLRFSRASFFWTQLKFPQELKKDRPDVLWMPLQTVPFLASVPRTVVTIHDLAFKLFPDFFPQKDCLLLNIFTRQALQRAQRVIAVSQNTKNDLVKHYQLAPEKISVVYHGFDQKLFNPANARDQVKIQAVKDKYRIQGDYLLYTGAIQPRKNLSVLVKAFEELKKNPSGREIKLVIAGPKAWLFEEIFAQIKASPHRRDIILTGPYKTQELPWLLGGASAFVFPSLYEGFGIPVLEAMACQTPVICANNSSLPEVGGNAVEYFDARSFSELSAKIKRLLDNPDLRQTMGAKGAQQAAKFSWEKCAQATYEALTVND